MDRSSKPNRADVHSPAVRSYNMSRVRGRDTLPEMLIRKGLHSRGHRFRLQSRELPGRPDLVFPRRHAVVFVHGCFWHGHSCPLFRQPATRPEFWLSKIESNRARDARATEKLSALGWRRLIVWECSLRGPSRRPIDAVLDSCEAFLTGTASAAEITGQWPRFDSTSRERIE